MKQVITDLLDSMNLEWKDSGQDFLLTRCMNPEHDDSSPSMFIQTEIGYGRCQSCGFQVFPETFIKDENTLEHHKLVSGYQQIKKKLELEEVVIGEEIFYLPPSNGEELEEYRGLSVELMEKAEMYVCNKGRYDNRIIFPFHSLNGALRGYTSRWLGEVPSNGFPKYIHSKGIRTSDHILYGKLIKDLGLDCTELVVTEGVMDALILLENGIAATPSLGFRTPSDLWAIEAIQLGVDKVVLAWDNDTIGLEHMSKLYKDWLDKIPTQLGFYNAKTMGIYKQDKYKDFHEYYTEFINKFKVNLR